MHPEGHSRLSLFLVSWFWPGAPTVKALASAVFICCFITFFLSLFWGFFLCFQFCFVFLLVQVQFILCRIFLYRLGPLLSRMHMKSRVRKFFREGGSFFHIYANKLDCGPSFWLYIVFLVNEKVFYLPKK